MFPKGQISKHCWIGIRYMRWSGSDSTPTTVDFCTAMEFAVWHSLKCSHSSVGLISSLQ